MRRKIAFTRVYASAPIAKSVQEMLVRTFPEYEVEVYTLSQLLKRRIDIVLINTLFALREYGFSIFKSKNAFRKAFIATPYLFNQAKRMITEKILPDLSDYAFSFQLQSLFDLSIPGLPHYVYTDHTHLANLSYTDFDRENLHSSRWIRLEEQIYKNATHVFTRSTNISRSLAQQYGVDPEKTTCVYVGVNVKSIEKDANSLNYTNKNILFVGIDWERKGGPDLAAAFEQVLEIHPDASLTVVGCSPMINLPNSHVYGLLPVEEVNEHYKNASIFCLPTHLEPFGVVFVEAMSYGLPIVATKIGAIPDFVLQGENGYLIAPGDVADLAEKLISILADPDLLREFGSRSRMLAAERYNWDRVGEKIRSRVLADMQRKSRFPEDVYIDRRRVPDEQLA